MDNFLVVSDLHLTDGTDPATGEVSTTEDFFWDREFHDFLEFYACLGPTTLVLNGDIFDFLQVMEVPDDGERVRYGIDAPDISPRYGLRCTEAAASFQFDRIVRGHPEFFDALAGFVALGNGVALLKGNHDVQLAWPAVQQRFVEELLSRVPPPTRKSAQERISVLPWNLYVPGRLYVEHGNQFEESCAFQNFLIPEIPLEVTGTGPQLELDLASLLVRYVVNALEEENPLADNVRPLSRYYAVMFRERPLLMLRTLGPALVFLRKAFQKASEFRTGKGSERYTALRRENERRVLEVADHWSKGDVRERARLERVFLDFLADTPAPTLACGGFRFLGMVLRQGFGGAVPDVSAEMRLRAARIARSLEVPVVAFGHSHIAESVQLPEGALYANTGTWMEMYEEHARTVRAPQFTHLHIEGDRARLLSWDGRKGIAQPVHDSPRDPRNRPLQSTLADFIRQAFRNRKRNPGHAGTPIG